MRRALGEDHGRNQTSAEVPGYGLDLQQTDVAANPPEERILPMCVWSCGLSPCPPHTCISRKQHGDAEGEMRVSLWPLSQDHLCRGGTSNLCFPEAWHWSHRSPLFPERVLHGNIPIHSSGEGILIPSLQTRKPRLRKVQSFPEVLCGQGPGSAQAWLLPDLCCFSSHTRFRGSEGAGGVLSLHQHK